MVLVANLLKHRSFLESHFLYQPVVGRLLLAAINKVGANVDAKLSQMKYELMEERLGKLR